MALFLLILVGAALTVGILACWLRRRNEDRSGEFLGLGEGSNLSAEPDPGAGSSNDSNEA